MGFVGFVRPEQMNPDEERSVSRGFLQIFAHLGNPLLAFSELDPAILEVECALFEAPETARVDEEDRRGVEGCGAVAVGS
jgi:hypothetical protein